MEFKDYYATLGVAKTATAKEVKQAYRKLARKHHPDVNPGDQAAENRFKALTEAYEVLGDATKRKKYDELGANWRMYEQAGPGAPGSSGGGRPAGGPGHRTMTEEEMHEIFGDADPFSDFFHTFFGGAGGPGAGAGGPRGARGRGRVPREGRDVEQEIELGLEDAVQGTTRRLSIAFDGEARTVDVRIPAGINDGARLRIAGEGERGSAGAKAGDLYLRIRLAVHPTFERKGRDLYTRVTVPVTTAVLGGQVDVPTLAGKPLRLKIPQTTQNGQVFRLRGHGMPAKPGGKPAAASPSGAAVQGDLYAAIDIELPKQLTAEQRTHYEALQQMEKVS